MKYCRCVEETEKDYCNSSDYVHLYMRLLEQSNPYLLRRSIVGACLAMFDCQRSPMLIGKR